jgi:hypothetical protein
MRTAFFLCCLVAVVCAFVIGGATGWRLKPTGPVDGAVTYECDMGHKVLRVIPDADAPRASVILLPFNPCGFKS